jgi:hypothetical protein
MMAPIDLPRHMMIKRAILALGKRNETSLALWTRMATALAQIIGDAGFESLFFRSLHQIEAHHPWLAASTDASIKSIDHLAACLATREDADSEEVSTALLIIFTDTLNLLIGELVTNRILLAAWGTLAVDDVPEQLK